MEVKIRLFQIAQLSSGKIHVSTSFDRGGKNPGTQRKSVCA
jgi:hypothetical protein